MLLIGKAVAAGLTGSLSVISAVIDSGVDLVSGALMWWSSKAIKNRDLYQYPQGQCVNVANLYVLSFCSQHQSCTFSFVHN